MQARDVMTAKVVSVPPEATVRQMAQLLCENGISAVLVVDAAGGPIGVVSEGDLIGRGEDDRRSRRDWWLTLPAEPKPGDPDVPVRVLDPARQARDLMSGPVVTVSEDTDVREIARLLGSYRIKRVPVLREGRIVGIVSRADLLRALAAEAPSAAGAKPKAGLIASALAGLDERFLHQREPETPAVPPQPDPAAAAEPKAEDFQHLVADFAAKEVGKREQAREAAGEQRKHQVKELEDHHVGDEEWRSLLHRAREAAEHGQAETMLLRFPSQLLSDGGRAINVSEADWPGTLRGEAAEIYLRWERELKPRGFRLFAQVLDFPDGKPGDIGLFLVWGV